MKTAILQHLMRMVNLSKKCHWKNFLKKAKGIISTRLGQTTPVVEAYRELKNGNIEVRVQTFYSMDKAREMVREGIRQQMEQDGEKLTPELEKLLGK